MQTAKAVVHNAVPYADEMVSGDLRMFGHEWA